MLNNILNCNINPKIGIKNLGHTSYLNAVLQCFKNIYTIANYFLKNNNSSIDKDSESLSNEIRKIFYYFIQDENHHDKEPYNPENIFKILSNIYTIKNYESYDPNEFLNFLLDRLHKEYHEEEKLNLNKKKKNNEEEEINKREKCIMDGINRLKHSIISDNFTILKLKELICSNCKNINYEFKSFNSYDLDITNCHKKLNNNLKITECLNNEETKSEKFCENCNGKFLFKIINRIYSSSEIFVFLLDRKQMDEEYIKIPFVIDEKIDLNNFIEDTHSPKNYELNGIVSISMREKKYVAFSKSPIDKKWYLYNDSEVQPVIFKFILESHNHYFNFYTPCILFYELVKND